MKVAAKYAWYLRKRKAERARIAKIEEELRDPEINGLGIRNLAKELHYMQEECDKLTEIIDAISVVLRQMENGIMEEVPDEG